MIISVLLDASRGAVLISGLVVVMMMIIESFNVESDVQDIQIPQEIRFRPGPRLRFARFGTRLRRRFRRRVALHAQDAEFRRAGRDDDRQRPGMSRL